MKTGHQIVEEYMISENRQLWSDLDPTGELGDDIFHLYEANYKYDMVSQAISREGGVGPTVRRYRNIQERLESKAWDLIDAVAPELEDVFRRWLDLHQVDNPEGWARAHMEDRFIQDKIDFAESERELQILWDTITSIGIRRGRPGANTGPDIFKVLKDYISESETFREYIEAVIEDEIQHGPEDWAEDLIDLKQSGDHERMYEEIVKPLLDSIGGGTVGGMLEAIMSARGIYFDLEHFVRFALREHIHPRWKQKWEGDLQGTIQNIEEMADDLDNIFSKNLSQAFITINRAIGATHSNGSMMEYVQEYNPSVDIALLDDLTAGKFTDEWDEELKDARIPL